jgi:hypothetical protein
MARNLADTVSSVDCALTENQSTGHMSGPFQGKDLSTFLYLVSDSLKTIAELEWSGVVKNRLKS